MEHKSKDPNPNIRIVLTVNNREHQQIKSLMFVLNKSLMRTIWSPRISDPELFDKVNGLMFQGRAVADILVERYPYLVHQLTQPRKSRADLLAEAETLKKPESNETETGDTHGVVGNDPETPTTEKPKRGRKKKVTDEQTND